MIFFFLVVLDSLYDLSFLTRGLTCAMTVKVPSPDHWITREFLIHDFKSSLSRVDSLEKTDAGRDWGQEEKGMTEDEMAGWHHRLDGHEFEWTLGVGDGQGGLVCCDSWGGKESDTTERLTLWLSATVRCQMCAVHYRFGCLIVTLTQLLRRKGSISFLIKFPEIPWQQLVPSSSVFFRASHVEAEF